MITLPALMYGQNGTAVAIFYSIQMNGSKSTPFTASDSK
jgi:hypothetical protein